MILFPNGKINLGLHILRKRKDGFHEIDSILYPVANLTDAIEVLPSDTPGVLFSASGLPVDCTPDHNLCVAAYNLLQKYEPLGNCKIHLHKKIPFGAGLGGGSADAAAVLHALNHLFELRITTPELLILAAKLGSDVPFFIQNTPAQCTGRGEKIAPVDLSLTGFFIVIIKPEIFVSTREAYQSVVPKLPDTALDQIITQNISTWKNTLHNDFEPPLFQKFPKLSEIKTALYDAGALYAALSGSGSALFGIFSTPIDPTTFARFGFVSGSFLQ